LIQIEAKEEFKVGVYTWINDQFGVSVPSVFGG